MGKFQAILINIGAHTKCYNFCHFFDKRHMSLRSGGWSP